ncbi:MAG TPA: hypothetical protein VNZ53_19995 [Steroidobacteraceae bacterium]|nr:hypothetical protein [Steroidobacteraceae bacterium]
MYEERYAGVHGVGWMMPRLSLQSAGLIKPVPRRSAHRKKRRAGG